MAPIPVKGDSDEFKDSWIAGSWHRFRANVSSATHALGNKSGYRDCGIPIAILAERFGVCYPGGPELLDVEAFRRAEQIKELSGGAGLKRTPHGR